MAVEDDWGRDDPSVRAMRQVFRRIEAAQEELLKRLSISPFDVKLRLWRETARDFFERSWAHAVQLGLNLDEGKTAAIYIHCLARAIGLEAIKVVIEILPKDEEIEILLKETLP